MYKRWYVMHIKIGKLILLMVTIIMLSLDSGCDYLFRGEYPYTYPDTEWVSNEPDWIMNVDSNNVMTSIVVFDGEQLEFDIKFRGHCMYVYLKNTSECFFSGHGIFNNDNFIISDIREDKFFNFKYEKIKFKKLVE